MESSLIFYGQNTFEFLVLDVGDRSVMICEGFMADRPQHAQLAIKNICLIPHVNSRSSNNISWLISDQHQSNLTQILNTFTKYTTLHSVHVSLGEKRSIYLPLLRPPAPSLPQLNLGENIEAHKLKCFSISFYGGSGHRFAGRIMGNLIQMLRDTSFGQNISLEEMMKRSFKRNRCNYYAIDIKLTIKELLSA